MKGANAFHSSPSSQIPWLNPGPNTLARLAMDPGSALSVITGSALSAGGDTSVRFRALEAFNPDADDVLELRMSEGDIVAAVDLFRQALLLDPEDSSLKASEQDAETKAKAARLQKQGEALMASGDYTAAAATMQMVSR